jgi:hypothetical protein
MIATKRLFPYQSFQGDHVLEQSSDDDDDTSEDEDDVANSMFSMVEEATPSAMEEQRQSSALREITKRVTQLNAAVVAQLPPHYRWLVQAFAEVAVEKPLVFETATHHELILDEFKEAVPSSRAEPATDGSGGGERDGGGVVEDGAVRKLGKFWKAGTYGEITCPAMDIVAVRACVRLCHTALSCFFILLARVSGTNATRDRERQTEIETEREKETERDRDCVCVCCP